MSKEKITTPLPKGVEPVSEELAWPMAIAGDEFRTKAAQSRHTQELEKKRTRATSTWVTLRNNREMSKLTQITGITRAPGKEEADAKAAYIEATEAHRVADNEQTFQALKDFDEKPLDPDFHVGPWPAAYDAGERAAKYDARASVVEEQVRREIESGHAGQKAG